MVHIKKGPDGSQDSSKYIWAQRNMQPWGRPLPAQCSRCKSFRPWGDRKNRPDLSAEFRCRGKHGKGDCNELFVAARPKNLDRTIDDWMVVSWPAEGAGMM